MTDARAGLWVCPECGDRVRMSEEVEPWDCVECGVEMEWQAPDNAPETVPKEDLRELVEELRTDSEDVRDTAYEDAENTIQRGAYLSKAEGIEYAADELEELIND